MRWRTEQQTSLFNGFAHAVETALELWFGLPLASLVVPLQLSISADGLSRQDPYLVCIEQTRQAFAERDDVETFIYDNADHGFNCWARSAYDQHASALSHGRTLAFLETLGR